MRETGHISRSSESTPSCFQVFLYEARAVFICCLPSQGMKRKAGRRLEEVGLIKDNVDVILFYNRQRHPLKHSTSKSSELLVLKQRLLLFCKEGSWQMKAFVFMFPTLSLNTASEGGEKDTVYFNGVEYLLPSTAPRAAPRLCALRVLSVNSGGASRREIIPGDVSNFWPSSPFMVFI